MIDFFHDLEIILDPQKEDTKTKKMCMMQLQNYMMSQMLK